MAKMFWILLCVSLVFVTSTVNAHAQQNRIYIANDDHTDYMWTANESTYRSAFVSMLDYYLNQANSTASNASPYQGRFSVDGSYWLWVYQQDRASRFPELINRIKDGHITVPLNTLAVIYGGQPAEAVIRGMYYPGKIQRQYGVDLPLALSMESMTLPYGLGSLWAGSGAKYTWKGVCACATQLDWDAMGNREHQMYWWQGLDGSRILTKWYSLIGGNQSLGGYAEARQPSEAVDLMMNEPLFRNNYPYNVYGAFGKGWDDLSTRTSEFITTAQQKTAEYTNSQVYVSNEVDFFKDFEQTYGTQLPYRAVSFGNEWDLFSTTITEYSSRIRRSVEKLRAADAMASIVSLTNPAFTNSFASQREQAYINLSLFWEHCGGASGSVSEDERLTWMKGLVNSFESYVNSFYQSSLTELAEQINLSGTNSRFFVFNPLSWARTDFADLPHPGSQSIKVVDMATGQDVPFQLITKNSQAYVRILAGNVPPLGYKTYEIAPGPGQSFPQAVTASSSTGVIENQLYKVTVAGRGAITSLIDKTKNNREFAKTVNSRFINDLGSATGSLVVESSGPVSATIRATSSSPVTHTTRITLYAGGIERIDIDNQITQNFTSTQTWAYGFNLTAPDTRHEEVGAVIRAKLASAGGHYSTETGISRFDYLTLNHFAAMSGSDGAGITLSNWDLDFMKLGNSTISNLDTITPQVSVVAGGSLGSGEDYSNVQADTSSFLQRFALKTHTNYSQTDAMKMALEHQNPLVAGTIVGGTQYPADAHSLLSISNPNVLAWTVKPHEDGIAQGLVVRVWNQADTPQNFNLSLGGRRINTAKHITHIETDVVGGDQQISNGVMQASINQQQIKTYRLLSTPDANQPTNTPIPPPVTPSPTVSPYDLDGDGDVDFLDLRALILNFSTHTIFTFNALVTQLTN